MNQKEHAVKIFYDTLGTITGTDSLNKAEEIAQLMRGYLTGIRLLSIINAEQFYAMDELLKIALSAVRHRKTAPGVTSTESGSKEGCPMKDNSLVHAYSLGEKDSNVKPPEAVVDATAVWLRDLLNAMAKANIGANQTCEVLRLVIARRAGGVGNA